jgi:hypothetical protein
VNQSVAIGSLENGRMESSSTVRRRTAAPPISNLEAWRVRMIRSPLLIGLAVFGAVLVAIIYLSGNHEVAQTTTQLVILAGLVLSFIDRHMRDNVTVKELKENTEITKKIPEQVATTSAAVAVKLVEKTAKTIDDKIDTKQAEMAEVIADKTSDVFQKAFKQGYDAGQEAMRREMESRRPPSF